MEFIINEKGICLPLKDFIKCRASYRVKNYGRSVEEVESLYYDFFATFSELHADNKDKNIYLYDIGKILKVIQFDKKIFGLIDLTDKIHEV